MSFCYQENTHFSQAAQCSRENFWGEIKKSSTRWKIESRRSILEAVQNNDEAAIKKWLENEDYQKFLAKKREMKKAAARQKFFEKSDDERLLAFAQELKDNLTAFIFSCREFDENVTAKGTPFRHRRLAGCHLNGLVMLDIDHVDNPMEVWEKLQKNEELMKKTKLVHITSSKKGVRVVFAGDANVGNLADNQIKYISTLGGYKPDPSCLDATRNSFAPLEGDVLYIDAENTLDVDWAKKIGVDVDKIYILQPKSQSAEEIFQIICDSVDTGDVGLWVLDSIGALMSSQELEKTMEDKTYGGIAKPLTLFGKKIEMLMQRHKCTGIGINQIREDLNSSWGGIATPGGKAWKHFCSVRMQFSRGKFIDEKGNELTRSAENPVGNIVMMSMTKNKTCPPTRRTGFYTINYEIGIDYLRDLIEVAIKYDIVKKSGAWFDIVDIETGEILEGKIHGQSAVNEFLEQNDEVRNKVEELVEKVMKD